MEYQLLGKLDPGLLLTARVHPRIDDPDGCFCKLGGLFCGFAYKKSLTIFALYWAPDFWKLPEEDLRKFCGQKPLTSIMPQRQIARFP